jgi:hypothetical protein
MSQIKTIPEVKAKQAEKVQRHIEQKASVKPSLQEETDTPVKPTSQEETDISVKPDSAQDFGPSEEEIRESERAHNEFLEFMQDAFESDKALADTAEKLKQALLELHHLKITNNGLVNTNTELIKMVKSLQRQLYKVKK